MKKLILIVSLLVTSVLIFAQTSRAVSDYAELLSAITASASGDIINVTDNIVVTAQVTLAKSLTINGNGYQISVPRPGLDDMGRYNTTPSAFRVFYINGSNVTINDLGIKGGSTSGSEGQGGAIYLMSNAVLTLNRCIVSNSISNYGGGGIAVFGTMYMNASYIRRNAARYGGGMLISGSVAAAYVDGSSLIENRSTSASGGGGGAEVNGGATIYFNNSTLANNQSTEIGGAINCPGGNVYFINSSATGNVAFGSFKGGAIGNNGGNVYILNSLFAYNYHRTAGDVTNPSAYVLDDVEAYTTFIPASQSNVHMYYSIYHPNLPSGMGTTLNNVQYTGASDGSNNTIFSGGILSKITDNDGNEIGAAIYRPFLYDNGSGVAPTLKMGSFVSSNRGTRTRFANNNNVNPAIAYYHDSAYTNLLGSSQAGQEVTDDQVNTSRANPPTRGAIEAETSTTLYIVKVNGASGGTITGGTIYGDVYPSGTSVTLTAIPYTGYSFVSWNYIAGGSGAASTSSTYTFTVNSNVTLIPVFQASGAGNYTITYIGNENTSGTPPATQIFSAPTTIADAGTLVRTGYSFVNWNTNSNGSGTSYQDGSSYSAGVNLTLYAQWQKGAADFPEYINTAVAGGQHTVMPTVDLYLATNQSLDAFPAIDLNPSHILYSVVVIGSGTVNITITTGATSGACYHSSAWHFAANSGGTVTFGGVDMDSKGDVAIILSDDDLTLPVELSSFTAVCTANLYVVLAWVAESETDHAGYNVLRNESPELSNAYKVNSSIITEGSTMGSQISYSYSDTDLYSDTTYYYWLESVSNSGSVQYFGPILVTVTNGDGNDIPSIPEQNVLLAAYPNPFNPSTLHYGIDKAGKVNIDIYNSRGQRVKSYNQEHSSAGYYRLIWDGTDDNGRTLSSGIYFYKMRAKAFSATRKMILSK